MKRRAPSAKPPRAAPSPPAGIAADRRSPYLILGAVALLVRGLYLLEIVGLDAFDLYLGDALSYHTWASAIAAGDWIGDRIFYQAPLYPYVLALVYATLGSDPLVIKLLQLALGAVACVLLALGVREFLGRRVGLLSGWLLAVYPPALFFEGIIQKAAPTGFLLCALLFLAGRYYRTRAGGWAVAAGAVLGLLALMRENALALAPIVVIWAAWAPRELSRGRRIARGALVVAGLAAVLLPVAARNQAVGGEFHLTTSQLGSNLYLGNNPSCDGTYQPLVPGRGDARYERIDATRLAEEAVGRPLSPGEVSRYWTGRVLAYVRAQPGDWLALQLRKLALAYNAVEIGDTEDLYTYAEDALLLRLTRRVLHMGVLAPLAAVGLVICWRRRREVALFYGLLAAYTAAVAAFFIFARYRYPLALLLMPFAAAALLALPELWRRRTERRGWLRLALLAALAAAVAVGANWRFHRPQGFRVSTHANIANELITARQYERAFHHLEASLDLAPDYPNAHHLMGVALSELGRLEEAERHFRTAIAVDPETALPYYSLGVLLSRAQRLDEAIEVLRAALRKDPTHANTYGALGVALAQQGEVDEALRLLEQGVALDPESIELAFNYGLLFQRAGRVEAARGVYGRILASRPGHLPSLHNLVTLDLEAGRPGSAVARLEAIARSHPDDITAAVRLAWILASHPDGAIRDGARALRIARDLSGDGRRADPRLLDLLAGATAETGDAARAAQIAERAARIAAESGARELAEQIRARARSYVQGRPWRQAVW